MEYILIAFLLYGPLSARFDSEVGCQNAAAVAEQKLVEAASQRPMGGVLPPRPDGHAFFAVCVPADADEETLAEARAKLTATRDAVQTRFDNARAEADRKFREAMKNPVQSLGSAVPSDAVRQQWRAQYEAELAAAQKRFLKRKADRERRASDRRPQSQP